MEKQSNEKVVLLSLCALGANKIEVLSAIEETFKEVTVKKELKEEQLKLTFHDGTYINFHVREEEEYMKNRKNELIGFFSKAPLNEPTLKKEILGKLEDIKSIASIAFALNEDSKRTQYIMNTLFLVAKKTAGLILQTDLCLYGPDKSLILSIDGRSDYMSTPENMGEKLKI